MPLVDDKVFNNTVLDLMTYQAFIAGLTHIDDYMSGEYLTIDEALLKVLVEMCDSEFAFAAIHEVDRDEFRIFASYPSPLQVGIGQRIRSAFLDRVVANARYDIINSETQGSLELFRGVRSALAVPYDNRGAKCVLCICNRDVASFARPDMGLPFVSHEIKMVQALLKLRPI
jgi:hypothetical protein